MTDVEIRAGGWVRRETISRPASSAASRDAASPGRERLQGPLRLSRCQRDFGAEFVAPSCPLPEKIRHAYKLQGWDLDWQEAGSRWYVSYTNVRGGS